MMMTMEPKALDVLYIRYSYILCVMSSPLYCTYVCLYLIPSKGIQPFSLFSLTGDADLVALQLLKTCVCIYVCRNKSFMLKVSEGEMDRESGKFSLSLKVVPLAVQKQPSFSPAAFYTARYKRIVMGIVSPVRLTACHQVQYLKYRPMKVMQEKI